MRRRTAVPGGRGRGRVPDHLATFDIDDWGGLHDVSAAFARWKAARRAHADTHGWPGGDEVRQTEEYDAVDGLPDEPFDASKI